MWDPGFRGRRQVHSQPPTGTAAHHALRVGDEVWGDVPAVELHALHHMQVVLCRQPAISRERAASSTRGCQGICTQRTPQRDRSQSFHSMLRGSNLH